MRIARNQDGGLDTVGGAGVALFRLVRLWSRRWAGEAAHDSQCDDALDIVVLEAVDAAVHAEGSASVTAVASQLGLDRSGASRMIAATVARGLVTKSVAPDDARRVVVVISASGHRLLGLARAWQDQALARMTSHWPPDDVRRFGDYLIRLADEQRAST